MKNLLSAFIISIIFTTSAIAGDRTDCVRANPQISDISVNLKSPLLKITTPPKVDKDNNFVGFTAKLKNGAILKYTTGGCVHDFKEYDFSNIKNMPQNLKQAAKIIKSYSKIIPEEGSFYKDMATVISTKKNIEAALKESENPNLFSFSDDSADYVIINLQIKKDGFILTRDFAM